MIPGEDEQKSKKAKENLAADENNNDIKKAKENAATDENNNNIKRENPEETVKE